LFNFVVVVSSLGRVRVGTVGARYSSHLVDKVVKLFVFVTDAPG
jgi:hypothetical protein